jgi:hypothetical protein
MRRIACVKSKTLLSSKQEMHTQLELFRYAYNKCNITDCDYRIEVILLP